MVQNVHSPLNRNIRVTSLASDSKPQEDVNINSGRRLRVGLPTDAYFKKPFATWKLTSRIKTVHARAHELMHVYHGKEYGQRVIVQFSRESFSSSMTAAKGETYRWPIIVCIAAFVAFFLLGGIMYATGVLFSELLKMPCDVKRPMHNASAERDTSSSTCGTSNATSRCDYEREVQWTNVSQTATDANATEECGGFGESRGKTGDKPYSARIIALQQIKSAMQTPALWPQEGNSPCTRASRGRVIFVS